MKIKYWFKYFLLDVQFKVLKNIFHQVLYFIFYFYSKRIYFCLVSFLVFFLSIR